MNWARKSQQRRSSHQRRSSEPSPKDADNTTTMISFLRDSRLWDVFKNNPFTQLQQQQSDAPWFAILLQFTCLKHNYSLRRQLVAGYGITAVVTIFIVVLIGIIAALRAGTKVKNESRDLFQTQFNSILQESGQLTGAILDKKLNHLKGSAELLTEIVQDRIVGYPNDGWEDDRHVPFVDRYTGRRKYPIRAKLLPRDWMVEPHLLGVNGTKNMSLLEEYLQERSGEDMWMPFLQTWNAQTAFFSFQGVCNPSSTNSSDVGYYPFCTDENNDASLGGKTNPTDTLAGLEQKAADIGVFLKAIYEAQPFAISAGVQFVNSGSGAALHFPAFAARPDQTHTSDGCEWMKETNPYTGRPLGTDEEYKRCTPAGTIRPLREYNGMERAWCADQATHPGETRIYGPYAGASWFSWRLTFGQAVFDRKTGELIACTHIDLALTQAHKLLQDVSKDMPSDIVLTKPDGTLVVGAANVPEALPLIITEDDNITLTPKLWETDFIDEETYRKLTDNMAFWETEWDSESASKAYERSEKSNGKYYHVLPSPMPPNEYDPHYTPEFYVFKSIDAEVPDIKIGEIDDIIDSDVKILIYLTIAIGILGLCCTLFVVTIVSQFFTHPLKWMEKKAWEIVNHTDDRVGDSLQMSIDGGSENEDEDDDDCSVISQFKPRQIHSFVPSTEIQELVEEFRSMISGFSGIGASSVALPRHTETKNIVTWKEDFRKFYSEVETDVKTRSVSRRMSRKSVMRKMSRTSSFRRTSLRTSLSASLRRSSKWNNPTSLPLSNSDFEKILAAADEAEQQELQNNTADEDFPPPLFRSTQMTDLLTPESSPVLTTSLTTPVAIEEPSALSVSLSENQSVMSSRSFLASATATATIHPVKVRIDSEMSQTSEFAIFAPRINVGSNIQRASDRRSESPAEEDSNHSTRILRSRLYLNVVCCIGLPLMAAIIAIMALTGDRLWRTFPKWIDEANNTSVDLEVEHLKSATNLIVKHIEQTFGAPLHDLYTLHRIAGWLLYDAVNLSDGFVDIEMEMADECKHFWNASDCPFIMNDTRSPCLCEWNDPWGEVCRDASDITPPADPRYSQKLWYINQDRNTNKTFPEVNYSPNTTSWYTNPDDMPGSENASSQGYSTDYDRVRAASALSAIIFPIYNYGIESRGKAPSATAISGYVSFEADGAFGGFQGCNYDTSAYSKFKSTDSNGAYKISDLCPKGQFGYDPRCRGWYDTTKRQAIESNDRLYISPPYAYAASTIIGITAASPLMDPKSGDFIGTSLVDFHTTEIKNVVDKTKVQYYAVIVPNTTDGLNVIASSEFKEQSEPKSIFDLMMPNDAPNSTNRILFEQIVEDMESEGAGTNCRFFISDENGNPRENCYVYEPIFNRELQPVQPDDFERGAKPSTQFLYSVLMYQDVDSISSEFLRKSDDINRVLQQTNVIYMVTTGLAALFCIIITATISLYVTRPIIQLLHIVKQVNSGGIEDDMPPLIGGSQEVHQVYASFAKLYKTVRMSNSAFFVGDLSLAHRIAQDALRLFRKIGDQKAIGIACNNMGNTLLAWMVECRVPGTSLHIEGEDCDFCTEAAIKYYTEAVTLGTNDFEAAIGDAVKAHYAQQLADRHFNRAMCLLLTTDDPCSPDDAKETALDDLFLAKQYDEGVREFMLHSKTLFENSDVIFERYLRRLQGLSTLIEIEPDVWDVWDIYELVDQADLMLQAAWNQDKAPLFHKMTKIGRLQELEGAVTGIELASGNFNDAVQIATRMFIEDEYLLDASFIEAADCIIQYSHDRANEEENHRENANEIERDPHFYDRSMAELKMEFKRMRKPAMRNSLDIGRSFVFCIDLKGEWNGQPMLSELRRAILTFYEDNFQPHDTVGIVTFAPTDGSLRKVRPSSIKGMCAPDEYPHRNAIVEATTGVACSRFAPSLQGGVDMALELESTSANDVFLLYVSDGGAYDDAVFSRLQNQLEASSRGSSTRANSKSAASAINLVIIGLGDNDHYYGSHNSSLSFSRSSWSAVAPPSSVSVKTPNSVTSFAESCKSLVLATRSRASVYLDADPMRLEVAFRAASASINEGTSFAGNRLQRALTMQKF